jgi:DNA-binding beta-propeller fold protein YncE
MKTYRVIFAALAVAVLAGTSNSAPLSLAGTTTLPGYKGDFDHFAIDARDNRVFLAGEDGGELEVFNRSSGALIKRLPGFGAPHSPWFMPATDRLLVVEGEKPAAVLNANTLKVLTSYNLPKGSDSIGWDPMSKHIWVVSGGKDVPQPDCNLTEIDPATGKAYRNVHFDSNHVEAMAIEHHGPRLFISLTDKNKVAVVDRRTAKVLTEWPIREAQQNAPLALDEKNHRLFVVTRGPGMLIVLNTDNGATVASFKAPERSDEVVWDEANRRVYVPGGDGHLAVFQQADPNHYRELANIPTLPGAKTAILDSAGKRLWVAASPGDSGAPGKLLWFNVGGQ